MAFLQTMINGLSGACPGARVTYRRPGAKLAQMRVDCPRNPATGLPETFFARAMTGSSDMRHAQIAFRRVPTASDVAWAEKYLGEVRLTP